MLYQLAYINFFESIHPISEEAKDFLRKNIQLRQYKKGDSIVKEGEVMDDLMLIREGMIRSYLNYRQNEVTTWVNWEGELVTSVSSFFDKSPSLKSLDCIESTIVEVMNYEQFRELIESFPEMQKIHNFIIEKQLSNFELRVFMSRIPNSRDRYDYFLQHYPDEYIERIPKKVFASLLAIRPETLSRIVAEKLQ